MDNTQKKGKDNIAEIKSKLGRAVFAPARVVDRVNQLVSVLDRDPIREEQANVTHV